MAHGDGHLRPQGLQRREEGGSAGKGGVIGDIDGFGVQHGLVGGEIVDELLDLQLIGGVVAQEVGSGGQMVTVGVGDDPGGHGDPVQHILLLQQLVQTARLSKILLAVAAVNDDEAAVGQTHHIAHAVGALFVQQLHLGQQRLADGLILIVLLPYLQILIGGGEDVGGVLRADVVAVEAAFALGVGGEQVDALDDVVAVLLPAVGLQPLQIGDEGGGAGFLENMADLLVAAGLHLVFAGIAYVGRQALQSDLLAGDGGVDGYIVQLLQGLALHHIGGGLKGLGGDGGGRFRGRGGGSAAAQQKHAQQQAEKTFHGKYSFQSEETT